MVRKLLELRTVGQEKGFTKEHFEKRCKIEKTKVVLWYATLCRIVPKKKQIFASFDFGSYKMENSF